MTPNPSTNRSLADLLRVVRPATPVYFRVRGDERYHVAEFIAYVPGGPESDGGATSVCGESPDLPEVDDWTQVPPRGRVCARCYGEAA